MLPNGAKIVFTRLRFNPIFASNADARKTVIVEIIDAINNVVNDKLESNEIIEYEIPAEKKQNHFYLDGTWHNTKDSMKLVSESGLIVLKYTAKQVNIVASNSAELEIFLNGENIPDYMKGSDLTSDSKIIINSPQLYNIIDSDITESHELIIKANKPNLEVFTFTFG